jgi:acyl carrier protein
MQMDNQHTEVPIPDQADLSKTVIEIVGHSLDRDPANIQMQSTLWGELGAESLDMLDIAFSLESEFGIRLPHSDLLGRAKDYFGDESIVKGGILTDFGLELIWRSMPELDRKQIRTGLTPTEFRRMIPVESLARVVTRLIELKSKQVCPVCSGKFADSSAAPELQCIECGMTQPYISGEQVFIDDMAEIGRAIGFSGHLSNGNQPGAAEHSV